jgi:hypothetical protein
MIATKSKVLLDAARISHLIDNLYWDIKDYEMRSGNTYESRLDLIGLDAIICRIMKDIM